MTKCYKCKDFNFKPDEVGEPSQRNVAHDKLWVSVSIIFSNPQLDRFIYIYTSIKYTSWRVTILQYSQKFVLTACMTFAYTKWAVENY